MLVLCAVFLIFLLMFLIYSFIPSYTTKQRFFKKKKSKEKEIYLTFDDGPSDYTKKLLDVLNKYNVKATFFCIANFANEHKNIIARMKNENHLVALHSLKHKNSMLQGIRETKKDLEKSLEIMQNMEIKIDYYRPPWGDTNLVLRNILKRKNIKLVLWNVMAEDWKANSTIESISCKLISRVENGDIICLHDGRGKNEAPLKTIEALDYVIPVFLEKGYSFKKINEYEY